MSFFSICYFIFAYLLGSISGAILFCRLFKLPDPRQEGSHNPGATNVYRLGGKKVALLVFLFDTLKGMLPVWAGYYLGLNHFELGLVAISACLGHIFPVFFQFKGGKGVATALGAIAPINWLVAPFALICWLSVFLISRYSSLSAVVSALVLPFFVWWLKPAFTFPVAMVCCLIVYRHHDNIQRLWRGQENRFSFRQR